ncbi:MAG TPA: rhodanese-like domain-containing protein [Patescibacteria group bacterium]|nr:rhodanese-like domain-containing protein [Patescibacteria group bacterium]
MVRRITIDKAKSLVLKNQNNPDFVVIDCRTPQELAEGVIGNPLNIDFYDPYFAEKIAKLDRHKTYLVYCRSGNRSTAFVKIMIDSGFHNVYNVEGGILG